MRTLLCGKRFRGVALLLAVVAAVSGCSAPAAQRPAAPASPPAATGAAVLDQAALALTSDVDSLRQEWYLSTASYVLFGKCLAGLGFRYLAPVATPLPSPNTVTEDAVGVGAPATYGVTVSAAGSGPSAEDRYVAGLPAATQTAYDAAFDGPADAHASIRLPSGLVVSYTTGGCLGAARAQLYGSVAEMMAVELVPHDVVNQLGTFLAKSSGYQSALTSWQRCMAAAGWSFSTPENAIESLQNQAAQPGVDAAAFASRQTAIADADVACDRTSRLRAQLAAQRVAFLRTQPASLVDELAALDRARASAAARAEQVLG